MDQRSKAHLVRLIDGGQLQLGLDERNLFELTHPDFAGERRVPRIGKTRVHKRRRLRESLRIQTMVSAPGSEARTRLRACARSSKTLAKYFVLDIRDDDLRFQIPNKEVAAKAALMIEAHEALLGNLKGKDKIRARVHKLITKKIAKHFDLDIRDDEFRFRIVEQEPAAEAVLNDICKRRMESIRSDVQARQTWRQGQPQARSSTSTRWPSISCCRSARSRASSLPHRGRTQGGFRGNASMASMSSGPACPNSAYHPTTPSAATRV